MRKSLKKTHKFLTICLAMALIFTMGMPVFGEDQNLSNDHLLRIEDLQSNDGLGDLQLDADQEESSQPNEESEDLQPDVDQEAQLPNADQGELQLNEEQEEISHPELPTVSDEAAELAAEFIPMRGEVGENGELGGQCTSFYMGKDTTANGSYLWGRTEDYSPSWRKIFDVHEAEDHASGEMFISSEVDSDFTWPYPERTLRYIFSKDSIHNEGNYPEPYGEVGINEKHVAVTATVTLSSGKSAITGNGGVDRMVADGLGEIDTASLVLMQAETARGACELLAEIVDAKGAAGREGTMIGDPNEIWYFQTLSGHQYVAVKCPDDKIGFSPNITGNVGDADGYVDINDPNVIASPGLIDVAERAGTFVGEGTKIKVADSYASSPANHQAGRLRVGYGYLLGYRTIEEIAANLPGTSYLNYFTEPRQGHKYTLYEGMKLLACRGEGTAWENGNPTGNSSSIGNDATQEAHVFETRPDMPDALATVEWMTMGPAEFSVYLPYYGSLITDVYEKYNFYDQKDYDSSDMDNNTMWHLFRRLHTLSKGPIGESATSASREKYGDGVKAFWDRYQKSLIEQQVAVDREMVKIYKQDPVLAQQKATQLSMALAKETYDYAKQILIELEAFHAGGAEGPFVPSVLLDETALPHYSLSDADAGPTVSIRTTEKTVKGSSVDFIVSIAHVAEMMNLEIVFEVDGDELSNTGFTTLNGMNALETSIPWKQISGTNRWEGRLTLLPDNISTGITTQEELDILKVTYACDLETDQRATMKLKSVKVAVWDESADKPVYVNSKIHPDSATTIIAKQYSVYDLNQDGVVDGLDLAIAQRYYRAAEGDADWEKAKIADVNGDGVVDLGDIMEIYVNFTR